VQISVVALFCSYRLHVPVSPLTRSWSHYRFRVP